jgi:small-conductance mechanosensitive channel
MKNLQKILDIKLIESGDYTLTIFHVVTVLLILIITKAIIQLIKKIFRRQENKGLEIGKSHAIYQIFKYIIWISSILLILDTVGIKITFLLASSAALLVGLGLGLQQLFQDFVSGITLLVEGTVKVGDIVETSNGEIGKVNEINLRTSKLITRDNIILIVPNSTLIIATVINWTHIEQTTRFSVLVGVAYGSDVDKVTELLLMCADEHKKIVKNPAPHVFFKDFGNSSLDFELLFYTTETFRVEGIKSDLRYGINKAFRENNITIPFPQRDIHIISENQ